MRHLILICLVAALALGACGKGGDGGSGGSEGGPHSSPEAIAKAAVKAISAKDVKGLEALFPTDDLIRSAATCKDSTRIDRQIKNIQRERARIPRTMDASNLKGATLTYVRMEERKSETYKKGSERRGCTFNMDVTMKKIKVRFTIKKGEKTKEEGEGIKVVKFGDKGWYLVDL